MLRKMIKSLLKSEYHGVTPLIADNTIQDTFNESEYANFDSKEILSEMIIFSKYAKYDPNSGRRESWNDLCIRNAQMHIKKYPQLEKEIWEVYARSVLPKKVVPAMRSFQFAGKAIEKNNTRMYNCSAIAVDDQSAFSEIMFLLLGGSGVGFSVQKHHINKLKSIKTPVNEPRKYIVSDDIMGWADSIKVLMKSYFEKREYVKFDFSDIRAKGEPLKTAGNTAPGPDPLIKCIEDIRNVLDTAILKRGENTKLKPIEVHDIICHIATSVVAGGIRRSSLISMFSPTDTEMLTSKSNFNIELIKYVKNLNLDFHEVLVNYNGCEKTVMLDTYALNEFTKTKTLPWYYFEPQRRSANNSVLLIRKDTKESYFKDLMKTIKNSKAGEPGVVWSNSREMLVNPCCEISIPSCGLCNLTEINASDVEDQEDLNTRVKDAVFLGTLQAGYTDFYYIREVWKKNAKRDGLLGVSFTGISSGRILKYDIDLKESAKVAISENIRVANIIGINPAKRIGTTKPAGTSSLVLKTSSGIHAWHNDFYIRRVRCKKSEALYKYAYEILGSTFVEDDVYDNTTGVISIPIAAPDGAILRDESPIDLLERVKRIRNEWIVETHIEGENYHNVSVTVSVKPDEWELVGDWMWDNREFYNGISLMDHDLGSYKQTPFEDITKEKFEELNREFYIRTKNFKITDIVEHIDTTNHLGEVACGANGCEINHI